MKKINIKFYLLKLKNRILPIACFLFISSGTFAQQGFISKYANLTKRPVFYSVANSGDSALLLGGSLVETGVTLPKNEFLLLKTDTAGQVVWNTNLSIPTRGPRWNMVFEASPNAIYCGGLNDSLAPSGYHYADGYVARFDGGGNLQWCVKVNLLDATEPQYISQLSNGDLVIGGYTSPDYFDIPHGFILRISPSGFIYWCRTFTFDNNYAFHLRGIYVDAADNIVMTGVYSYPLQQFDSFIAKMDSWGNFLWQKKIIPQNGTDWFVGVTGTGNEYFFTAARSDSSTFVNMKLLLLKTDNAGNIQYANAYTTPLANLQAIVPFINSNGELFLQALFYQNSHCLLMDSTGNVLCSKWAAYPSQYRLNGSSVFQNSKIAQTAYSYTIQNLPFLSVSDYDSCELACYESFFSPVIDTPVYTDSSTVFIVTSSYSSSLVTPIADPNPVTDSVDCIAITGIRDNVSNNKPAFSFFPNPFSSEISITLQKQKIKELSLTIKNILGQIVFNKQENNINNNYTKTIDLSFLSKGIYLLDVNIDGGRTVEKIAKE